MSNKMLTNDKPFIFLFISSFNSSSFSVKLFSFPLRSLSARCPVPTKTLKFQPQSLYERTCSSFSKEGIDSRFFLSSLVGIFYLLFVSMLFYINEPCLWYGSDYMLTSLNSKWSRSRVKIISTDQMWFRFIRMTI